ncbi:MULTISPECIES: DUF2786 domain-containing protein [Flavobacterium]|uniref:DUF2786 domain-containing protein n=1 Tax=Flavobacterium jumunjinense TaxID=998845 RepID=A0ABV5GQ66_9FLAO|nr:MULTISPECIES: DUF2786 domain-containing protein [Flavobacterium]
MDKIKAKIKALLSKTIENGATKQEMEASLKKANELMIQFFISEHDLKEIDVIEKCTMVEVPLIKSGYDMTIFYNSLSKLFDCEYFYNSKRIAFFGHKQDTQMCEYFYNLICRTCLKESEKYRNSIEYQEMKSFYHGRTLISSFIKGFLIEIALKIEAMYSERERNIPQSYGLMIVEKKSKVKKEFEKLDFKISINRSKEMAYEKVAFNSGREKGKAIEIAQGIDNSSKQNNPKLMK